MIEQLEALEEGLGFQWAADRVSNWIKDTKPARCDELIGLIDLALNQSHLAFPAAALEEESRRIWYLQTEDDVFLQRAVCRFYEALSTFARNDRKQYLEALAAGVFIAASKGSFTDAMYQELQASFQKLIY